jgi:hypothetical protein
MVKKAKKKESQKIGIQNKKVAKNKKGQKKSWPKKGIQKKSEQNEYGAKMGDIVRA